MHFILYVSNDEFSQSSLILPFRYQSLFDRMFMPTLSLAGVNTTGFLNLRAVKHELLQWLICEWWIADISMICYNLSLFIDKNSKFFGVKIKDQLGKIFLDLSRENEKTGREFVWFCNQKFLMIKSMLIIKLLKQKLHKQVTNTGI